LPIGKRLSIGRWWRIRRLKMVLSKEVKGFGYVHRGQWDNSDLMSNYRYI
jgi:hypothetical protein